MQDIYLADETFDINLSSLYSLSIQASLNGFSFCVLDTTRNKYILLKEITFDDVLSVYELVIKLEKLLDDDFFSYQFKSVNISLEFQKSTLVPSSIFLKEKCIELFSLNQDYNDSEKVLYNKLSNIDTYNLFAVHEKLEKLLLEKFPIANIYHHATPFIENILSFNKNLSKESKVYVNISSKFIDIVAIENSRLKLHNSFKYNNEDDMIYFVMFIYEQLKFNPEVTELVLSGEINIADKYHTKLKRYIRRIRFDSNNDHFNFSYKFNEIPQHKYNNLLNLHKCE